MADDVFQRVDGLEQATIERIIDRLEYRGTDPVFSAMRDAYLDDIDLASADRVIEIGCGTGVVARAIAQRREFTGDLYATDLTKAFIDAAVRLAEGEGLDDRIRFAVGDSNRIAPVEGGYDIVIGHTLISHVEDPDGLVAKAASVLAPGGRLVLFDGDYASLVTATGDADLDARVSESTKQVACANPTVLRELPRLLRRHGLVIEAVLDHVYSEIGHSQFFLVMAEYAAPMLGASGKVATEDVDRWLRELRSANDDDVFFGACNYYTYIAQEPTP